MANHEVHNSGDLAAAVNNQPQPIRRSTDHNHDVVGVAKHLKSHSGEKSSAVADELISLANPEHDADSQFSSHPKNMRSHLPSREEQR